VEEKNNLKVPSSRCGMPTVQAALGLWKHMVQLASKVNTGEDPASKAATWTLIADYSTPVLLALAAMPPGVCDMAGLGQDVAASSAVLQVCLKSMFSQRFHGEAQATVILRHDSVC